MLILTINETDITLFMLLIIGSWSETCHIFDIGQVSYYKHAVCTQQVEYVTVFTSSYCEALQDLPRQLRAIFFVKYCRCVGEFVKLLDSLIYKAI